MCLSMAWAAQLCTWIIIVIALISILRVVVPWIVSFAGFPAPVVAIINIILWAVVAIACVYILFDIFACLFNGGGLSLGRHY